MLKDDDDDDDNSTHFSQSQVEFLIRPIQTGLFRIWLVSTKSEGDVFNLPNVPRPLNEIWKLNKKYRTSSPYNSLLVPQKGYVCRLKGNLT